MNQGGVGPDDGAQPPGLEGQPSVGQPQEGQSQMGPSYSPGPHPPYGGPNRSTTIPPFPSGTAPVTTQEGGNQNFPRPMGPMPPFGMFPYYG